MPGCPDADGDGVSSAACGGSDCDDGDPLRYPGAAEVCDGDDEDCDDATFGTRDADGDGVVSNTCCNGTNCGLDCDDASLARRPGQLEVCDGLDNNCDGAVDETMNDAPWYPDTDGDLFGARGSTPVLSCTPVPGHSLVSTDCDDTRTGVSPLGIEMCNGRDDNCDGDVDEGCAGMDGGTGPADAGLEADMGEPDAGPTDGGIDLGDSGGIDAGTEFVCSLPQTSTFSLSLPRPGATLFFNATRCQFVSDTTLPASTPVLHIGLLDPATGTDFIVSAQGGGALVSVTPNTSPISGGSAGLPLDTDVTVVFQLPASLGSGYVTVVARASVASVFGTVVLSSLAREACSTRMAPELAGVCDGLDSNCNGMVDEGVLLEVFDDTDGDGVGAAPPVVTGNCTMPPTVGPGQVTLGGDCNDFNPNRSPLLSERCDGSDNDCDGTIDEEPNASATCALPFTTASCVASACAIGACTAPYDNCDGSTANGCETNTGTSAENCGGCGVRCADACTDGACTLSPIIDIAAGTGHACFLRASGRVSCFGRNDVKQLGDGTTLDRYAPVPVVDVANAVEIDAADGRTCARLASGNVMCWGNYSAPRVMQAEILGMGPSFVLEGALSLDVGQNTIGIRIPPGVFSRSNFVKFFGSLNTSATLTAATNVTTPDAAAGNYHFCTVSGVGGILCAGFNDFGQLGNGTTTGSGTPISASGTDSFEYAEVAAGGDTTCARRVTGEVSCWGSGAAGQLGNGMAMNSSVPVSVSGLSGVLSIAVGASSACAITTGGALSCWGESPLLATSTSVPTAVTMVGTEPLGTVAAVDLDGVACVLRTDATYACAGSFPVDTGGP